MGRFDDLIPTKTITPTTTNRFGDLIPGSGKKKKELDLEELARQANIPIPSREPKLSFLQRLGAGLGAFTTGEAVATGLEKGFGIGAKTYLKGVGKGLASAITGRDIGETQKRSYKDILEKAGMENKIAKFGLGFLGDVLLDPTTYFGGAIAKGVVKGFKVGTGGILKGIGKAAPKAEIGLRLAGKGVEEAFGKAFKFGYGTSKGLPEKALEIQSALAKTKEGIVRSNIERLGTGILSKSQQEELVSKLLAGKRAEFAGQTSEQALQIAKSTDPLVQKTIQEQIQRSSKFAKVAGIDDPYTVYFPGIAKDRLKRFFEGTRNFRVGSEGYKKEFKNLLKDDELIRNPAEAFARREFEIAKDSIVRTQLNNIVKEFGKRTDEFKNADEALKAGYQAVKEKGMFGKEIGYLLEKDKKFLDNLISPEFSTIDAIAKHIGFDAITSLFKRSVTGLFAPFHVRNYVSGLIQNYEVLGIAALRPDNIALGQRIAYKMARGTNFGNETIKLSTGIFKLDALAAKFVNRFGNSSSYIADIADATRGAGNIPGRIFSKQSLKTTAKTLGLGQQAIPFRIARTIGNFIETQQKATAYVTALKKGLNIEEALHLATRAGFDYRALTGFESKILRRIIPFYSFTRKNIELQLKTLGENPQRINNIIKLLGDIDIGGKVSTEEKENLADFQKEQFVTRIPGLSKFGERQIGVGFGTPIEQFASLFGRNPILKQISSFNPLIKVPIELNIGKDTFRQRDLKDSYTANEYSAAPQFLKNLLKIRPVEKDVYIEGEKTGQKKTTFVADPYRLLVARSLFTARGASYLDKMFDGDLQGFAKFLDLTTGVKAQVLDVESQKFFKERDKQRELEEILDRYDLIKKFEKYYVPK